MGEAVQDAGARAEPGDGAPVFLLIQEKAGLLAVFHIDDIADAIFRDRDPGVEGLSDKALKARQTLFFTDLGVAPLIDPPDHDPILRQDLHQGGEQEGLEPVDAQGQGLHDQNILVLVHGQPRQEVRLAEDQAA